LAELYDVAMRDGTTYYFTSHHMAIIWNGHTYIPAAINRDPIRFGINLEMDTCKVYMGCLTGDVVEYLQQNNLDAAWLTIKQIVRGSTYAADKEVPLFVGMADVEFNRDILILELKPWIDSLNIQVPRNTYQEPCNWFVFDDNCGLDQSSFSYMGAATTGSRTILTDTGRGILYKAQFTDGDLGAKIAKGQTITGSGGTAQVVNIMYEDDASGRLWYCELSGAQFANGEVLTSSSGSVTVSGSPGEDGTFFARGELYMRTGDNAGQRRPILSDLSFTLTSLWPMPALIAPGDSYTIYPGCDGRAAETCHSWYGNDDKFYGFLYIPRVEEAML